MRKSIRLSTPLLLCFTLGGWGGLSAETRQTNADVEASIQASWELVDTLRNQGKNRAALTELNTLKANFEPTTSVQTGIRLGGVLCGLGRYEEAQTTLKAAVAGLLEPAERAAYLLELGNVTIETGALSDATAFYRDSATYADQANMPVLAARASLNALRANLDAKDIANLERELNALSARLNTMGRGRAVAELWVSLGNVGRRAVTEFAFPLEWRGHALAAYTQAQNLTSDPVILGWAAGFMGALYEDEGRITESLTLTRKALFYALQVGADDQLYRWEWQLGRILKASNQLQSSQEAYARATEILSNLKSNFTLGSRNTFNRLVAPVYSQYADVLLTRSATMTAGDAKQTLLRGVRDQLETLKQAEVEDYFASECVAQDRQPTNAQIEAQEKNSSTAILYPVFLEKRIELLVEVGDELAQFTTPIGRNQATQLIRRFRLNLERPLTADAYLAHAQQLYNWLMRPMEGFLDSRGVKTLVMVPEGALRTIPISALHDGKQFLVERYAIATTPAIKLTQQTGESNSDNLLIGGLTEAVQGYSSLPAVEQEISNVAALYPAVTMQDSDFQLELMATNLSLGKYSIAHFATHGEFHRDFRKSFILTYDSKLTLSRLQNALKQRGDVPLDLLVLSACQTAAGDDRAALGLAGVAVQSGARSALASLWSISDTATTELIRNFYGQLQSPGNTKAASLRQAQLALLRTKRFQHPSFWAPYLLIGSWL